MKNQAFYFPLIILCAISFTACTVNNTIQAGQAYINRKWMLKSMGNASQEALLKAAAYIDLTNPKQTRGKSGCNTIMFKTLHGTKNSIRFTSISSTEMYCEPFMKLEKEFTDVLRQISMYSLNGHQIAFKNKEGKILIEAVAADWD